MNELNRSIFIAHCLRILGVGLALFSLSSYALTDVEKPERVNDIVYGEVLYEYHQGHAFQALSLLNVAHEKGGIKGHGEHPKLVEGGLLLSYGMTQAAKKIFEVLLHETLSRRDQNLAWFYLGKVFYLEQHYTDAMSSFEKIHLEDFKHSDQDMFYEQVYLSAQMSLYEQNVETFTATLKRLPVQHIYRYYCDYNYAVSLVSPENNAAAIEQFTQLKASLLLAKDALDIDSNITVELAALYNQTLLTLGQLYLQQAHYERAFDTLKHIDKDSLFSDQGLFFYAIAGSHLQHYERALSALHTLNTKTLFNPWQQQTPYALGHLYEQLDEPVLALETYRAAVASYQNLQDDLSAEKQNLSETTVLSLLNLKEGIGTHTLEKDAYGRVRIPLQKFDFSKLLATETFQRQLSELHELHLLNNEMHRWAEQLDSFEDMLATRLLSRQQKLHAIKVDITAKEASVWINQAQIFKQDIDAALHNDDAYFFMTEEQIDYFKRIQKVRERLDLLPDDHAKKAQYLARFERAKAYFDWWVQDEYIVNRWRTVKSLNALQTEMQVFHQQFKLLASAQELDKKHAEFVARITEGRERLKYLKTALTKSLSLSSQTLVALVDDAMEHQLIEIKQYLLASREALARVSDSVLVDKGEEH